MSEEPRGIGDNSRIDPTDLLRVRPEMISPLLGVQYSELVKRGLDLSAALGRWETAHKNDRGSLTIADQADNDATSDFYRQLASYAGDEGEAEEARKKVKRPIFEAGKAIDGWFNGIRRACTDGMSQINGAQKLFVRTEEARLRAERDRALQLAKEEADRLAQEALAHGNDPGIEEKQEEWLQAEQDAHEAQQRAAATTTELLRSKSALGTTTSVSGKWIFEVTDMMELCKAIVAGKAPLEFIATDDRMIKAAINRKNGKRDYPGLAVTQDYSLRRTGT